MDRYAIASELAFYLPDRAKAVRETSSGHLFGQVGLMYERWFPAATQRGRQLLLVAWNPADLSDRAVAEHVDRLDPVQQGLLVRDRQPIRPFYYRFGVRLPLKVRYRCVSLMAGLSCPSSCHRRSDAMVIKKRVLAVLAATALACAPVLPAAAAVHGPGFGHGPSGLGTRPRPVRGRRRARDLAARPGRRSRDGGGRLGAGPRAVWLCAVQWVCAALWLRAVLWLCAAGELCGSAAGLLRASRGLPRTAARLLPGLCAARLLRPGAGIFLSAAYPYYAAPRAYYGAGYRGGHGRGYTYSGHYGYPR